MSGSYTVDEALEILFKRLESEIGWKYLKSQRMLKKTLKNLVFEINFYTSKWNESHKNIEVNAEFRLVNKDYGKLPSNVNNIVAWMAYQPDTYWYDITTEEKLNDTFSELNNRIQSTAVKLFSEFEKDPVAATKILFENYFDECSVSIDFVADMLGVDTIKEKAKEIYDNLSDEMKEQVVEYKNGIRNKTWMINRGNLKYIIDENLI